MEQNLFGQILINFNICSQEQLDKCIELQRQGEHQKLLGEILVEQGVTDEKTIQSILSVQKRKMDISKTRKNLDSSKLRERLMGAPATEFLKVAKELGGSDLYLTSGMVPLMRLHGNLVELPIDPFDFETARQLIFSLISKDRVTEYYKRKYLDFSLAVPGVGRFRTNIFRHFRGIAGIFRVIPDTVWPFEQLGLPKIARSFINYSRGLVLVTGPTGSGKSTTLASLVDLINKNRRLHVITIEDPIENIFQSERSFVSQREIPTHSRTFATALRAALREDPDVIVVGEMRDPETVATAITAAETGHLVMGTLHTANAYRTVLRVLDQFTAQKRAHIRTLLAGVLRAVISQQLIPNIDGKGLSLACEVLVVNAAVSNLIREDKVYQIPAVMQTSGRVGMHLMDDSLLDLLKKKKISMEEALSRAADKNRFFRK